MKMPILFKSATTAHTVGVVGGVAASHLAVWIHAIASSGGRVSFVSLIITISFFWVMAGIAITAVTFLTTAVLRGANTRLRLPPILFHPIGAALLASAIFAVLALKPPSALPAATLSSFIAGLALAFAPADEPNLSTTSMLLAVGRTAQFIILASVALVACYAAIPFLSPRYP